MNKRQHLEMTVQDHLGFIALLHEARANKLLARFDMNRSQFTLLFLLDAGVAEQWTISTLAEHLEMKAPGISKIVSQLSHRGWLNTTADRHDGRKKYIELTAEGREIRQQTLVATGPFVSDIYSDWKTAELNDFCQHLEKLKEWLDRHRDDI